jgi:hypothetical protein
MKSTQLNALVISGADACKLFGRGRQWVLDLANKGYIKKAAKAKGYRLVDVCQGYVRALKDAEKRASKGAAQTDFQNAKTREIEQRIARQQHLLLPTEEVLAIVDEAMGGLKSSMDGLAASVTRDPALRTLIQEKVDECFKHSVDAFGRQRQALRTYGAAVDPDADDGAGLVGAS